jgi:DNA-binding CsgD family transcriptional regulator
VRTHDHRLEKLTACEREVLELIAEGLRNPAIARRLWKSEKAIEKTVARVFGKLGLDATLMPDVDRRVTAACIYLSTSMPLRLVKPPADEAPAPLRFPRGRAADPQAIRGPAPLLTADIAS